MKKFILLLTAAVTALAATACSSPRNSESLSVTGMYFDTVVTIEAWGTDMNTLNHCMEMCRSYEQLLSAHIETSEISAINHAEGQPVTVSEETAVIRLQDNSTGVRIRLRIFFPNRSIVAIR